MFLGLKPTWRDQKVQVLSHYTYLALEEISILLILYGLSKKRSSTLAVMPHSKLPRSSVASSHEGLYRLFS